MCGIVGFISSNYSINIIQNMLAAQSYRGPDDSGTFICKDVGVNLGHNRLSIQDLSSHGHQPFISDCKNYIIVFNGEVYNFKKIRDELILLGYSFVSSTDTEVILYSYKEWGISCIEKFIGMFAFSIYDKTNKKLFLVRDRAGVKPLYYYYKDGHFVFSSELKSFHQYPDFEKNINKEVLPYYFQFGYIPAPYSIFKDCYKIQPGHYLELDLQTLEKKIIIYWDVDDFYEKPKFHKSEKEILDELENILDDAINLRMISDVPVGVFLSGGYDSSFVVSILSKKQGHKINTFTIGFDDEKYDEAKHAKVIASYLATNHSEYYMKNKDMLDLVEKLPFYYDEPFGDSSALPTMIVSKLACQKVTVVLSSDGGDEAFCGYSKYFFLNKFLNIFSNKIKRNILKVILNLLNEKTVTIINNMLPNRLKQTNIKDKFNKFKRAINSKDLDEMFLNASSYVANEDVEKLLKFNVKSSLFSNFMNKNRISFLSHMMSTDYKTFMNDDVLTKVDRATMSVSLEGREPLLDHRIIEFMAQVPDSIKYKNKIGKYLLREILYKYLPKELVDKPKSGFQIPLNEWLRGDLKHLVLKYLHKDTLDSDIFNITYIEKIKEEFFSGKDLGTQIWFILMYQMWAEKWVLEEV